MVLGLLSALRIRILGVLLERRAMSAACLMAIVTAVVECNAQAYATIPYAAGVYSSFCPGYGGVTGE